MRSSTLCYLLTLVNVFVATTGPVNGCDLPSKFSVNGFTLRDTCLRVTNSDEFSS